MIFDPTNPNRYIKPWALKGTPTNAFITKLALFMSLSFYAGIELIALTPWGKKKCERVKELYLEGQEALEMKEFLRDPAVHNALQRKNHRNFKQASDADELFD